MKRPSVTYDVEMARWIVTKDFDIKITRPPGIDILIAEGYITDLASIPRLLWRVIAPFELSITAPLVHDFFYQYAGCGIYSRKDVDQIFLQLMKEEYVSWWRRTIAYRAVRIFGGSHWKGGQK